MLRVAGAMTITRPPRSAQPAIAAPQNVLFHNESGAFTTVPGGIRV